MNCTERGRELWGRNTLAKVVPSVYDGVKNTFDKNFLHLTSISRYNMGVLSLGLFKISRELELDFYRDKFQNQPDLKKLIFSDLKFISFTIWTDLMIFLKRTHGLWSHDHRIHRARLIRKLRFAVGRFCNSAELCPRDRLYNRPLVEQLGNN